MKRHLTISIDANRVTCGKCTFLMFHWECAAQCRLHGGTLNYDNSAGVNGEYQRCAPCLAAEREAT